MMLCSCAPFCAASWKKKAGRLLPKQPMGLKQSSKYLEVRPDITTMDIVMPKKSGIEALSEITGLDKAARVVMCSAMGQESLVDEAKQAGAKGYIIKPFDPQRVKGVIRKVAGL